MRMPVNELLHQSGSHIQIRIVPGLLSQQAVEQHQHEHISQFFYHMDVVRFPDGIHKLITFLPQGQTQAFVGLFPVPGTSAGSPQPPEHPKGVHISIPVFLFKGQRRKHNHRGRKVSFLPVQRIQRNLHVFICPIVRLNRQRHWPFIRVKLLQPVLYFPCQQQTVQFIYKQGQIRIRSFLQTVGMNEHAFLCFREGRLYKAHAPQQLQFHPFFPAGFFYGRQLRTAAAAHDGIDTARPLRKPLGNGKIECIKILRLFIQIVHRYKRQPCFQHRCGAGMPGRLQKKPVRSLDRLPGGPGHGLGRGKRRNDQF